MPALPPDSLLNARLVVDLSPGAACGGPILDADARACALLGDTADVLRSCTFADLAVPDQAQAAMRLLRETASATGASAADAVPTPEAVTRRPLVLGVRGERVLCVVTATRERAADGRLVATVELTRPGPGWENWAVLHAAAGLRGQSVWAYDEEADRFRWISNDLVHSRHHAAGHLPLQTVMDQLHPDDVSGVAEAFWKLRRGESDLVDISFRYPDGEGGYRWLSSLSGIMRLGFEGPRQIVGSTADHTHAVRRREALAEEHSRQSRLVRELAAAFIAAKTEEELTEAILHKVAPAFAGTGTLLAFVEEGRRLRVTFGDGIDPAMAHSLDGMALDAPKPLAHAIRKNRMEVIDSRADYRAAWPQAHHLLDATTAESFLMVPFAAEADVPLGGWVITYDRPHRTTEQERTLLNLTAELAGQAWARIRLSSARVELAGVLQRDMLPAVLPATDGYEIATRYLPAHEGLEVGGDWYDVIAFPDGSVACIIGDVQGHNIQAAALMGQVRTAMHAYAWQDPSPDRVLRRTNELMLQMGTPGFATCLYVLLDPQGRIRSARAGHVPPVRLSAGEAYTDETPGALPLGVMQGTRYPLSRGVLAEGETLALFTDGVVEGPQLGVDSGTALVARAMEELRGRPVEEVADALMSCAVCTEHQDDRAVLLVRRTQRSL
ncbi:SpoIIE family protein phosphatase [Streptomyces sp. NPDC091272]|uniref:SpoIIE family protein phosphatase n=1 Tax=Streptomyces sp. NPDC091272 TaxID=3365981 RepID=UPI003820596D